MAQPPPPEERLPGSSADVAPGLANLQQSEARIGIATLNSGHHQQITFIQTEILIGACADCDVVILCDANVSDRHCRLKFSPAASGWEVEIINLDQSVVLGSGARLHRDQPLRSFLPIEFSIGDTRLQIFEEVLQAEADEALNYLPPLGIRAPEVTGLRQATEISPAPATLAAWLEAVGELQKSVASSRAFFKEAARAIFNPGGLDGSFILLPQGTPDAQDTPGKQADTMEAHEGNDRQPVTTNARQWKIVASHIPYSDSAIGFREDLVNRAVERGVTIFHDTSQLQSLTGNGGRQTAVVCPVVNHQGEVMAVVYGFRGHHRTNNRIGARTLEAQFVQLIANSILSAMTRLEKEAEATRSRVLLEQAFSPQVARHLEVDPHILEGRTTDVTVLFADLRNFAAISEQVGPKVTYQLLTEIMDRFSDIIAEHDGVIIDYFGDGLSAFWNAPIAQPNHVLLACRAAEDLVASLPELNEIWAHRLQQRLRVGIGVHTGVAQVGNSGSNRRLKYGPRGSTVNIASRLESATKGVGLPILVSETVAAKVKEFYLGRRICRTALAGIGKTMNLFELFPRPVSAGMIEVFEKYDRCLELYEERKFHDAITLLCQLNLEMPDQATEFLLEQAMNKNKTRIDRRKKTNKKTTVTALTQDTPMNAGHCHVSHRS